MTFKNELQNKADDFKVVLERYIAAFFSDAHKENDKFKEAISYSLLTNGKRLRPILLLETYKIFGGRDRALAEAFAVAIECIHNYSLVHDDMPCMDDDEYRRGELTTHKAYGEDIALLVGDGLLNMAYEIMIEASLKSTNENSLIAMREIAANAGVKGMVAGQAMELLHQNRKDENLVISIDTALKIRLLKTSCLFTSSILAGAMLTGLDYKSLETLKEYANLLGLAFQLKDDIMDNDFMISESDNSSEQKYTIENEEVAADDLHDEEKTYKLAQKFVKAAKEKISTLDIDTDFYNELADYMISRNN